MPRPVDDEADAFDVDALELLTKTPAYRMIAARLEDARFKALKGLAIAQTWDEARKLQGVVLGLETALGLPAVLVREIRESARSGN